ncbi:MAG: hypothetical protein ACD_83C00093G0001 [uncultured bacterium]|nr:MAG: hypothetical protein ACD_83C00093G0001 [uncultured bacterium]
MDNQPNDFQNFLNHKFSDVLDDYARFVTQKEEQVKTRTNKEEEFITQFLDIRSKFIWPVFSALKAEAEKRKNIVEIETEEPHSFTIAQPISEYFIIIYVYLKGLKNIKLVSSFAPKEYRPHLCFYCDFNAKVVRTHQSTIGPGHGGYYGWQSEHSINKVNQALIEKELFNWLESLVKEAAQSDYY